MPQSHFEKGYPLGSWVAGQRNSHSQGKIGAERIARLEALPGWSWNARASKWEEGFSVLRRFAEREGNSRPPAAHQEGDYRLGQWVAVQRSSYGQGKMGAERMARLESLPGWTLDARAANWEEGFSVLRRFAEREGHSRPPAAHQEGDYRLGQWVTAQRGYHRNGKLDSERASRRNHFQDGLGMPWTPCGRRGLNISVGSSNARARPG